ncbi:MAG: DUF4199 domain-containing protein [Bacteroidetes bacterium]|nr:DUF4199 domain-containing protein [Bacteroidota bacterium]NOG95625.1 DUF4199 domain-containing protein [Bacteroidota bacterium]GIK70221.1 MAG: hypothetical protein BroJett020_15160 [Bacteroidota bacterium]
MLKFSDIKEYVLKFGLIFGLVQIIINLLLYIMGIEYLVSWWIGIVVFLFIISFLTYMAYHWRKKNGGYAGFMDIFSVCFFIYAISGILTTSFNITFYHVLVPDLPMQIEEAVILKTETFMYKMGVPESEIEKALDEMKGMAAGYSPGAQLKGYFYGLIFGALLSGIMGLIFKKKPDFEITENNENPDGSDTANE